MSLCEQHSLGVYYNCIFQSSTTGFIIGGNMPLYSPSPHSGNQLSRLVYGDILCFQLFLYLWVLIRIWERLEVEAGRWLPFKTGSHVYTLF